MSRQYKSAVKTLAAALATAGLLAMASPALADRDDRGQGHKGRPEHAIKHGQSARFQKRQDRQRQAKHRGNDRDHRSDRRADRGRDHRRDNDHRRGDRRHDYNDRGHHDRDRRRYAGGHGWRDRGHDHHRKYYKPVHRPHKHRWRPNHYHYGYRWSRLPKSYVSLTFGGLGYYFSDGIFYRPYGPGYVVAQAPVGAIVYNLPGTAVSVSFGGLSYYVAYDTYYRWDSHRRGYRVVANPGFY
ncbi:DUF6515 family protein [uncultured Microbulbifer sp.]|uniref:DUF6515 family protein n=1 Tax=uncultured Microbulbifer sp. TaxID=348147 RepID=UPI0025D3046D|nr:DUF6515 family protein [uncultured Microbulbifer sp.]